MTNAEKNMRIDALNNGKLIRKYNELHHFLNEDDDEQMETLDESEIKDYLKWVRKQMAKP